MQRQVPAVLRVRHPSDSVHRQSVGHSCCATETGIRSATVQVARSFHSCFLADEVAAALVVDFGSCMFRAGFAGDHAIRAVLPLIGDRPKIFGILVGMERPGSGHRQLQFTAGFAGDHAIRAVFLMIGGRPMIFVIMVDMDQRVCVSLRSSFVFQRNAWFGSGYNLRSSTDFFVFQRNAWFDSGYICRARRRVGSGMVFAGLLVTMISRCVHFVVGRSVESSQVRLL